MISVSVTRGGGGTIRAFTARNHGRSDVCAAVSMLILNTVNSIEALTDEKFTCDYDENGGFIRFETEGEPGADAALLLNAMALGLESARERYGKEIKITETNI